MGTLSIRALARSVYVDKTINISKMAILGKTIAGAGVVAMGCLAYVGYEFTSSLREKDKLREELQGLQGEHDRLKTTYNDAVKKTAVTELLVCEGELSVSIRNAHGEVENIPTPYDPSEEIYVDYVVLDGRLWIRRVFDAATPPNQGTYIDPSLGNVNWEASGSKMGKAVYRSLTDGRWLVTVTGDGSLGLAQVDPTTPNELTSLPEVREFEPEE